MALKLNQRFKLFDTIVSALLPSLPSPPPRLPSLPHCLLYAAASRAVYRWWTVRWSLSSFVVKKAEFIFDAQTKLNNEEIMGHNERASARALDQRCHAVTICAAISGVTMDRKPTVCDSIDPKDSQWSTSVAMLMPMTTATPGQWPSSFIHRAN